MTQVVVMPLDDGGAVYVEVAGEDGGLEHVGRGTEVVGKASETLQEAIGRIRPAAEAIRDGIRSMAQPPDRVVVEFGVKVTGEAGVIVAKATSEANFTVKLEWGSAI
ncbi:CU044_2847 family protein [Actinoplanes sp. NPDC023714]|uniref:CU044_2847 family protein n=1 Tax=Actinoplanes sp. NPDC023714 TaxID=3154322 RepID=UPI0033F9B2C0